MHPRGPELVSAYTYTAGRLTHVAQYAEAVAAAERALALAAELGLPEPAFALSWRGVARCQLGQPAGVEDVRRALQLALEQGLGRETGVIHGSLAGMLWFYDGPQSALDTAAGGIDFCERRGITELVQQLRAITIPALAEVGQTEQALLEAGSLADRAEAAGDVAYVPPRALELQLHAERGTAEEPPAPERFVSAARDIGLPGLIAVAFAAVAQLLLARRQTQEARALLLELDQIDARVDSDYAWLLPSLVRVALALDDRPLAHRLSAGVEPLTPLTEHAVASARAQLVEAAGEHADAAEVYAEAAGRWRAFGNVPQRAYALLGQGRCLAALGMPGAEAPLREARDLFASMGYKPAREEAEALLSESEAAAV